MIVDGSPVEKPTEACGTTDDPVCAICEGAALYGSTSDGKCTCAPRCYNGEYHYFMAKPGARRKPPVEHEKMETSCTFPKGTMPDWVVDAFRVSYEYCLKVRSRLRAEQESKHVEK